MGSRTIRSRTHHSPYATKLLYTILLLFVICSLVNAQAPAALPTIDAPDLNIKKLDKDYSSTPNEGTTTTKTVVIVITPSPTGKTHHGDNDGNDDSGGSNNPWQNGDPVEPYMVAPGDSSSTASQPDNTASAGDGTTPTDASSQDANTSDNPTQYQNDGSALKRMVLISSIMGTAGFVSIIAVATLLLIRRRDRKRRELKRSADIELQQPTAVVNSDNGGYNNNGSDRGNGSSPPHTRQSTAFNYLADGQRYSEYNPSAPMLAPLPPAQTSNNALRTHYLDIPQLSDDISRSRRNTHTLAQTQAIPPPSAPSAKELGAEHEHDLHYRPNNYLPSTSSQQPSSSQSSRPFRDDASIASSQDAPPAYTPSAPPSYLIPDYPSTVPSRHRQQSDSTTNPSRIRQD
ncbi:hypothetical protein INT43_001900 [Umbelopsis isabellina]|uniref:Mid2 domain-containing protein n=1 Tax=Mortierella isabellina TaxID=91625 RepID=A0A8H7PS28_MORIS|nr:hypothetical protein INT43_001900 [Umbelopsis isabellina]